MGGGQVVQLGGDGEREQRCQHIGDREVQEEHGQAPQPGAAPGEVVKLNSPVAKLTGTQPRRPARTWR